MFSIQTTDLSSAMNIRKKLLSKIKVYALEAFSTVENNTCMNDSVLNQLLEFEMIYSTDEQMGEIVTCVATGDDIKWYYPKDTGSDCDYKCKVPLLDNHRVVLKFKIVSGTPMEHAKFCTINSACITKDLRVLVETQRTSATLEQLMKHIN